VNHERNYTPLMERNMGHEEIQQRSETLYPFVAGDTSSLLLRICSPDGLRKHIERQEYRGKAIDLE
jgi:hypothetical protein